MRKLVFILCVLLLPVLALSAQDEPIEITFVHIFGSDPDGDNRAAIVQQVADAFMEENPDVVVTVQSTSTSYDETFNNALLAAEQGNPPNIVQVEEGFTQLAIDSEYFVPIGEVATEEQLASLEDVLPTIRSFYNVGDTTWSVPWNSSNPLLYYNKTMFEAAGLDPETPPATFADILTACEALMNSDLELSACINWPMVSWFPEQWVAMQNGLFVNNDNGRAERATEVLFDSPEMLKVVEWWKELDDAGYYTYSGALNDYNGEGIAFLSRQSAMTINSTAGLALFIRFSSIQGFELGVTSLPIPDEDATNGMTVGGASLWLSAGQSDAQLQAANDFIWYLTQTENDIVWHQGTGYMPNRLSAIEQLTEDGWFDENPFYRVAVDQLSNSNENPATAGGVVGPASEVRGYLLDAFQSIIDGNADPLEALQVAKSRADEEIEAYNSFFAD